MPEEVTRPARIVPPGLLAFHAVAVSIVGGGAGLAMKRYAAPPDLLPQLFLTAGTMATYGLSAALVRLAALSRRLDGYTALQPINVQPSRRVIAASGKVTMYFGRAQPKA